MLSSQSRPAQAVFHIDTNSIIVGNYKYLGVFEWRLNYKSCKTWIKLPELLMGEERAVKLSLGSNWLNVFEASGVASSWWFIVSSRSRLFVSWYFCYVAYGDIPCVSVFDGVGMRTGRNDAWPWSQFRTFWAGFSKGTLALGDITTFVHRGRQNSSKWKFHCFD